MPVCTFGINAEKCIQFLCNEPLVEFMYLLSCIILTYQVITVHDSCLCCLCNVLHAPVTPLFVDSLSDNIYISQFFSCFLFLFLKKSMAIRVGSQLFSFDEEHNTQFRFQQDLDKDSAFILELLTESLTPHYNKHLLGSGVLVLR